MDFKEWLENQEPQTPQQPRWKSFQAGQQREFGFQRQGPWLRKPDPWVPEEERPSNYKEQKLNVYHVTTNLAGVRRTFGLRSRAQLGGSTAGLGGGFRNEAANMVSTTYNYDKARTIYDALQYMCSVVRNEVSAGEIMDHIIDHFSFYGDWDDSPKFKSIISQYVPRRVMRDGTDEEIKQYLDSKIATAEQKYNFYIALEDALGVEDDAWDSGEYYPPNRVGFTASFQAMSGLQHNQIAILQLAVRQGAEGSHVQQEEEVRFLPEDLRVVRYFQP